MTLQPQPKVDLPGPVAPWHHTGLFDRRMSLVVRAWLRIARLLTAAKIYPSMERIPNVSIAKRKASKPPSWMSLPPATGVEIVDRTPQDLGLPVATRSYAPADRKAPLPIVVFTHGGGFVNGGLDAMQFFCAHLAVAAHMLVISVDYPLSPESAFPEALEASYDVLRWAASNGAELGGDPQHLFVAGDSAGGNLAAALCLLARRLEFPRITKQVLIYPTLDATQSSPRLRAETPPHRGERFTYYGYYAAGASPEDELLSPLLAESVDGLPDAVILTAEHDALRDDGILYAQRLRASGTAVRFTNYLGMPHGFLSMPRLCRSASSQAILEIATALRESVDSDIAGDGRRRSASAPQLR
jgi:acetyl esterase